MIYLNESQAGRDDSAIGFPHVLLCMAVVLQTRKRLYGFHFDDLGDTNEYAEALLDLIGRKAVANGVRLYGCCNHDVRYEQASDVHAAWRAEMKQIAAKLGYNGRVSGFDTSIIHPEKGTYIGFYRERFTDRCRIYYKRNEKMAYTWAENSAPVETSKVITWERAIFQRAGSWRSDTSLTASANLDPEKHATKLHELNYFLRQTTFQVP